MRAPAPEDGPERRWRPIGPGAFRVEWDDGSRWILEATPDQKYPWLLYSTGEDREQQAIGTPAAPRAQRQAECVLAVREHLNRVTRETGCPPDSLNRPPW